MQIVGRDRSDNTDINDKIEEKSHNIEFDSEKKEITYFAISISICIKNFLLF